MPVNSFEISLLVTQHDLDDLQHVNNVVYLQWVQDAALAHWRANASKMLQDEYNWVVLRHEIDYKSPAVIADELVLKTWVYNYNAARSIRIVQISRKSDNKLLAEAKTTWCLLFAANNKPVRIGENIKLLFAPEIM
ncbi:MAG TPA: thioesterase family protein [Ferruginibacter sp.]|nr:thioesterase family protein [Ferruginibacter sp.]